MLATWLYIQAKVSECNTSSFKSLANHIYILHDDGCLLGSAAVVPASTSELLVLLLAATWSAAQRRWSGGTHTCWIARHVRRYRDGNEKEQRFQVYQSNLQLIANFNSLGLGFYLIDNKFADLTNDEFRDKISCLVPPPKYNHESTIATKGFLLLPSLVFC